MRPERTGADTNGGKRIHMRYVKSGPDDDLLCLEWVESVVAGVVRSMKPDRWFVVKIDNWFGKRWLRFSPSLRLECLLSTCTGEMAYNRGASGVSILISEVEKTFSGTSMSCSRTRVCFGIAGAQRTTNEPVSWHTSGRPKGTGRFTWSFEGKRCGTSWNPSGLAPENSRLSHRVRRIRLVPPP